MRLLIHDATNITETRWGNYEVVRELPGYKIKILTVNPGCGISYQKHFKRAEVWFFTEGELDVAWSSDDEDPTCCFVETYQAGDDLSLPRLYWHQFWNFSDKPAKILEIQIGECEEEDIERIQYEWIGANK